MEDLLKVSETAKLLGCHPQTLYKKNDLPRLKIPSIGVRYKKSDIDKYVEDCREKTSLNHTQIIDNNINSLIFPPGNGINKSGGISEMAKAKNKTRFNFGFGAVFIRKTSKGEIRWYLEYKDATGKRQQKLAPHAITLEDACIALQKKVEQIFDRTHGVKRQKELLSFKDFSQVYLDDYSKPMKKSWKSDASYLQAHLEPYFGEKILSEISQEMIEKYISKRLKQTQCKSSINRELACLRKMFNKAIDWDYVRENPVSRIKLFSEKDNYKERVLSFEEEKRLLKEAPAYLKPIILTALQTGMRKSEIFNLKWEDVSLEAVDYAEIRILKSKSGRIRIIPINPVLFRELKKLKDCSNGCSHVFTNPRTGKPFTDVKRSFKAACSKADIHDLRFHDLRHTFATRLLLSGADIITARDLLGHSSVKVTERYTHSNKIQKREAVNSLSQEAKKEADLLHICDMDDSGRLEEVASSSNSIN